MRSKKEKKISVMKLFFTLLVIVYATAFVIRLFDRNTALDAFVRVVVLDGELPSALWTSGFHERPGSPIPGSLEEKRTGLKEWRNFLLARSNRCNRLWRMEASG